MLTTLARAVRALSLGIWLGAGVMTFITAQVVFFGHVLDHETAGNVMGPILHVGGWMRVGLAVLALLGYAFARGRTVGWVGLILATVLVAVSVFYLEPTLVALRPQFAGGLDNPAHAQFKMLHGMSMGMAVLELVFVAVALVCAVI